MGRHGVEAGYTGAGGSSDHDTHQLTCATGERSESFAFDPNGNRTAGHPRGAIARIFASRQRAHLVVS